jgi:hypothetical protein
MKVGSVLITVGIFLIFTPVFVHAEPLIYVDYKITDLDIHPGNQIKVPVRVANTLDLYGVEFKLYFNPTILGYNSYDLTGSVFEDGFVWYAAVKEISTEEAYFHFAVTVYFGEEKGIDCEDELIVTVLFDVLDYGIVQLHLADTLMGNSAGYPIPYSTLDGFFNNVILSEFSWSPSEPMAGEEITLDGSASRSNAGRIISYQWDFGDGTLGSGKIIKHTYKLEGSYEVRLLVKDEVGWEIAESKIITISEFTLGVDLIRRSAWPEHHHFDISRDEDGLQDLFAKVRNLSKREYLVKVRFEIEGAESIHTDPVKLAPGMIEDLKVSWGNYAPGKRYTVYARALYSEDGASWYLGKKIKKFGFAVVE